MTRVGGDQSWIKKAVTFIRAHRLHPFLNKIDLY